MARLIDLKVVQTESVYRTDSVRMGRDRAIINGLAESQARVELMESIDGIDWVPTGVYVDAQQGMFRIGYEGISGTYIRLETNGVINAVKALV